MSKTRNFVFKNDEFCRQKVMQESAAVRINNDEFCIENKEFCIKRHELCIQSGEFCIQSGEFCIENDGFMTGVPP